MRFNRASAIETADTVTRSASATRCSPTPSRLANWDYKKLAATAAEEIAAGLPEDVPPLEIYEGAGAYRYTDEAESAPHCPGPRGIAAVCPACATTAKARCGHWRSAPGSP